MSSTLAHPYRDPGQYRLPPELPLERSSSGGRRGWLVASLAAHVTILLLLIYPAEIQQVDPPQEPEGARRVDLRLVVPAPSVRYDEPRHECHGPEAPEYPADPEDVPPPPPLFVAPRVLDRLRIFGETQLLPSAEDELLMLRRGVTHIRAVVKVCVGSDGAVAWATLMRSSGYVASDARVMSAIRNWRYRPYLRDGVAHAVCSTVTMRLPAY